MGRELSGETKSSENEVDAEMLEVLDLLLDYEVVESSEDEEIFSDLAELESLGEE